MAWTEKHHGKHRGRYRDSEGNRHSTPVYPSKRAALQAAQEQESRVRNGTWLDPMAGKISLKDYVENQWLSNRGGELATQIGYRTLWNQIKDEFGDRELRHILSSNVQGWVTRQIGAGVAPATIRARFVFLQTVLAAKRGVSAMRDGLIDKNPCYGVMLPTVPERAVQVYEAEDTERLLTAMDPYWRPLVMFAADTGLRWGELMGVTVQDFELDYRALSVNQTVVEVAAKTTGNGTRFAPKAYPKGKRARRIALTGECRELVRDLVAALDLGREDRLFSMPAKLASKRRVAVALTPQLLAQAGEFVAVNGRSYTHGTVNGYQVGKCRCPLCKQASADYRYSRLPNRIDTIPFQVRRTTEWPQGLPVSRSFFRESVWLPAHVDVGLEPLRFHDLRASHISWLLSAGVDLPTVMERAGHREFATTRRYTTTLKDADEKVLDAMRRICACSTEKKDRS